MVKKSFIVLMFYLVVSCTQDIKDYRAQINQALEDKDLISILNLLQTTQPSIKNLKRFHDKDGNNILHLLVEKNDVNGFRLLSTNHQYDLPYNRYNNEYETPLSLAISEGKCQMAELLIIKGADPLFTTKDHPTPLVSSILKNYPPCIESILIQSKNSINQKGLNEWQAIHYASYLGMLNATQILLSYNPDLFNEVPIEEGVPFYNTEIVMGVGELNPFQLSIMKGNLSVAKLLFSKVPEYAKKVSSNGTTNLELAQLSKSVAMIAWVTSIDPDTQPRTKPEIEPASQENVFDEDMQNIQKGKK